MKLYNNESVITIDCDETLVNWADSNKSPAPGKIMLKCPYVGDDVWLTPNWAHIRLLKQHRGRGFVVIVWSSGGVLWANEVVRALNLEDYVDIVLSKPTKYVDDKSCEEWMGTHVYLDGTDTKWGREES